jgi:prepilin-type N-terminal cleavage/methylation domain-containing protein
MKINTTNNNLRRQGFTLIEMIGVLAVIAILAAVLIPKVFEAINNSRINNAAMTCQTVKTAVADHYAKWGGLAVDGRGATTTPTVLGTLPYTAFDEVLLGEGFLDKPFAVKIGDGIHDATHNRIQLIASGGATPVIGNGSYDLDGVATTGTGGDDTTGTVVEAVITATQLEDAKSLDRLIDGPTLSYNTATATSDMEGRVKWAQQGSTGTYDIHIYLTHR